MDIIKHKLNIYTSLLISINEYFTKVEYAYSRMYDAVGVVRDRMKEINSNIDKLKATIPGSVESAFMIINTINTCEELFESIYNKIIIDTNEQAEVSNTAIVNIRSDAIQLEIQLDALLSSSNAEMVHIYFEFIRNEPIETINNMFEKYERTVDLYSHYLQYALNNADARSILYIKLLESLEVAKHKALVYKKQPIGVAKHCQRFGLIPVWSNRTKEQVLGIALYLIKTEDAEKRNPQRTYGGKEEYTTDELQHISDIFKERKRGLYVMSQISSNQISFDFEPLVRKKVAEHLSTPPNTGVTLNVIKKFDNIKQLDPRFGVTFKNFLMGDTTSTRWLVIRTLDGVSFDILGFDMENAFVGRGYIDKLERGPSPLINNYQTLCNSFLDTKLREAKEVKLTEETMLHDVSTKVTHAIMTYVDEVLKTPPTNMTDLYEIISGDSIDEISSRIIIQSYEDTGQDSSEMSSTFLFNADYIISIFTKSIREDFAKSSINSIMFRGKTTNALVTDIRTSLTKIIKNAADRSFDPQKDIYEKLLVKKILLNNGQ